MLTLPLAPALAACSAGKAAAGWRLDPHNPVLGGSLGVCFDPAVHKLGSLYRMWFSWRTRHSIAYTESPNGYRWSAPKIVLTVDPASPAQVEVNRPGVLVHRGIHHMWFTGQTAGTSQIYYATSADGISWSRVSREPVLTPARPWEQVAVMCPNVIWDEASARFHLYYSGGEQDEPNAVGFATSTDGVHWSRSDEPVFVADRSHPWERDRVTGCDVHKLDGWYYMFYIGFSDIDHAGIGLARSRDGLTNWQRHPRNPILSAPGVLGPFSWDREAIYKPAAVLEEQRWTLFFNARGRAGPHNEQIGMATHPGIDLGF